MKFEPTTNCDKEEISQFQSRLKSLIGGRRGPRRLAVADFLERYCAYSLPASQFNAEGILVRKSAASHIQQLMSMTEDWDDDRIEEICEEIIYSFLYCEDVFPEHGINPFHTLNKNGNTVLHKVKCVAALNSAAIILELDNTVDDQKWIDSVIVSTGEVLDKVPEKQTGKTVWDYHLTVVHHLFSLAKKKKIDIKKLANGRYENLLNSR